LLVVWIFIWIFIGDFYLSNDTKINNPIISQTDFAGLANVNNSVTESIP
jgi:hypothetical protein